MCYPTHFRDTIITFARIAVAEGELLAVVVWVPKWKQRPVPGVAVGGGARAGDVLLPRCPRRTVGERSQGGPFYQSGCQNKDPSLFAWWFQVSKFQAVWKACFSFPPQTAEAQIGSGVVRGGPEVRHPRGSTRFHQGSTRVPPGFHQGFHQVPPGFHQGFHQGSTRVPPGFSPGFHQGSARVPPGACGVVRTLNRAPHAVGDIT